MKPLIISHANCYDGYTSAWLFHKFYKGNIEIFYAQYGQPAPDVTGKDVIMVDFSYKRSVLLEMKDKAKSLLVLDHHASAKEDLAGLEWCLFDMNKSGAMLTWEYLRDMTFDDKRLSIFFNGTPKFIQYVQDRDLWRFALPNSKSINAFIGIYDMTFELWDKLYETLEDDNLILEAIRVGDSILHYRNHILKLLEEQSIEVELPVVFGQFAGMKVLTANAPYAFASDLGNILASKHPSNIGICWFKRKDGQFQYSIRGINNVDVSKIAKQVGGGGHRLSSGFESKILLF